MALVDKNQQQCNRATADHLQTYNEVRVNGKENMYILHIHVYKAKINCQSFIWHLKPYVVNILSHDGAILEYLVH